MGITIDLPEDLIRQADRLGLRLDPATVKALLTESLDAKLAAQAAAAEAEDPATYDAWFRQAVADGIADADAGREAPMDVVRKRVLGGG
jgi:predicted transcriptional regulator